MSCAAYRILFFRRIASRWKNLMKSIHDVENFYVRHRFSSLFNLLYCHSVSFAEYIYNYKNDINGYYCGRSVIAAQPCNLIHTFLYTYKRMLSAKAMSTKKRWWCNGKMVLYCAKCERNRKMKCGERKTANRNFSTIHIANEQTMLHYIVEK